MLVRPKLAWTRPPRDCSRGEAGGSRCPSPCALRPRSVCALAGRGLRGAPAPRPPHTMAAFVSDTRPTRPVVARAAGLRACKPPWRRSREGGGMTARRPGVTRRLSSHTTRGQLPVSGPYAAPRAQTQAGSARPKPGGRVCRMTGGGTRATRRRSSRCEGRAARKRAVLERNAQADRPSLPLIQYLGTVSHKAQPRSSPGLLDTRGSGLAAMQRDKPEPLAGHPRYEKAGSWRPAGRWGGGPGSGGATVTADRMSLRPAAPDGRGSPCKALILRSACRLPAPARR